MGTHVMNSATDLAVRGGPKAIGRPLTRYNPIGAEELDAVREVMESGVLSQFIGAWHPDFHGGPKVQAFERALEKYFGVKHAVTVNSCTSGLIAALGAAGIEPGDEVIVTPWTMAATATAILHWNAIPVFADIEPDTFCLDPESVRANITPHTRAIMATDIFGLSANVDALNAIAKEHGLVVISDTAQAPGARVGGRYTGTATNAGVYSLNYHKHIHTGEGGFVLTDDDALADRTRLIRNHAEVVVGPKGETDLSNMVGHNFRLGEIESAIGLVQLGRLAEKVASRQRIAARFTEAFRELEGVQTPVIRPDCTHAYYVYPLILDVERLGVSRQVIRGALEAEGLIGLTNGYQNIHLLPMYQQKIAYGKHGFPWSSDICKREVSYARGICPVAERLHAESFMGVPICAYEFTDEEVDLVIGAFRKVWANLDALRA